MIPELILKKALLPSEWVELCTALEDPGTSWMTPVDDKEFVGIPYASDILFDFFAWNNSPQGNDFWKDIYNRLLEAEENGTRIPTP